MLASIVALPSLALLAVALPPVILQVIDNEDNANGFNPLHHLAGDSPYFNSPGVGLTVDVPEGCSRTRAAYLFRHTDIYANDFEYENQIAPFLYNLGNFSDRAAFRDNSALAFLADWTSPIDHLGGQLEEVTNTGKRDAQKMGGIIAERHHDLITDSKDFRIWVSNANRDRDTAHAFVQGMNGALSSVTLEIIDEGEGQAANSLMPHESCPAFDTSVERPGCSVTGFCNLFDETEWLAWEYANDLMYHRSVGYGSPIAPVLGMPRLSASTRLLTGDARANATNPSAASQSLFISFTHREEPPFIVTALGVLNETNVTMTENAINYERAWRTSYILPLLANIALERLECNSTALGATAGANTLIRALVNAAPLPLPGCSTGPGGSCEIGSFSTFIKERARLYGDFIGACGLGNETNATNTLGIHQGDLPTDGSAVETETVQINGTIDVNSTTAATTPGSNAPHHNAADLGLAILRSVALAVTLSL